MCRMARRPASLGYIDRLPDAVVAVNDKSLVLCANRSFLDLIQVAVEGAAVGENLGRWLSELDRDFTALLDLPRRNRSVRLLPMTIIGDLGTATRVEVSTAGGSGDVGRGRWSTMGSGAGLMFRRRRPKRLPTCPPCLPTPWRRSACCGT